MSLTAWQEVTAWRDKHRVGRLCAAADSSTRRRYTWISSSRPCGRFEFDQPISAASFTAWVELQLCPTQEPGDIVVMDNLSSHKRPAVRTAIRDRGAHLLFLPPYSPDLNLIEQVCAKLKHLLRKATERSIKTTWRRIGTLRDAFSSHECATTSETQAMRQCNVITLWGNPRK
jgi:transposase